MVFKYKRTECQPSAVSGSSLEPHCSSQCSLQETGQFYLTSIYTLSLSRNVFEIFDFNVFKVWQLDLLGHLRSKILWPFESPYVTSYRTSNDTFSLSRTVFEIFDFKVVRIWHLTFRRHLGSTIVSRLRNCLYMASYLTCMDTFSLSHTVFEILGIDVLFWMSNVNADWNNGVPLCWRRERLTYYQRCMLTMCSDRQPPRFWKHANYSTNVHVQCISGHKSVGPHFFCPSRSPSPSPTNKAKWAFRVIWLAGKMQLILYYSKAITIVLMQ